MSGSLVRMCSSTRIPPRSPISRPAAFASVVSGRTPSARITTSAGYVLPDFVFTSSAPAASCVNPATPSPRATVHAVPLQVLLDEAGELAVERGEDLVEHLDERHLEPAWIRFSAVSRPMNPPPITTARRGGLTNWIPE